MENKAENPREDIRKRVKKTTVSQAFQEHGKLPPQAVDLEEAVLGAMMLEKDALSAVIDIVKPEIFYKEAHQIIFRAIFNLFAKAEPIDLLTVTNELRSTGELSIAGGPYYIVQLTTRVASAANIEYHVRIITQKYIQRELIRISTEIIHDSFEDTTDVFDLLDKAERNLFGVSDNNFRRNYDNMATLVKQAVEEIEKAKNKDDSLRGVPSGFTDLDRVTAGWQKSDLVILAARPGMGKTAFVLSMARNIAVDHKKPVAVFSLEMASIQLVTRLIASETELPAEKLRRGNLQEYEWEQLHARIKHLVDAPLFIDDTPALSIFELRAKSRRLMAQHKIEIIIVDYLQLMTTGGDNKGNREQEISTISRSLKALAKELNIPIIALSQLNRSVETRGGNKRPLLSDLRESGAIEQDADLVLFIYRPEVYKIDAFEDNMPTQGMAEIIVAKHRNGALHDIRLRFIDKFAKFADPDSSTFESFEPLSENSQFYDHTNGNTLTIPSKMNDEPDDDHPF